MVADHKMHFQKKRRMEDERTRQLIDWARNMSVLEFFQKARQQGSDQQMECNYDDAIGCSASHLHQLCLCSTLLMLETNRFLNAKRLAEEYNRHRMTLLHDYSVTTHKQLFVCRDIHSAHMDQMLELNEYLEDLVDQLGMPAEERQKRRNYVEKIRMYCQSSDLFQSFTPYAFGSSYTDFCMRTSDFDVTLIPMDQREKPYTRSELKELLHQFKRCVDSNDFQELHVSIGATMLLKLLGRDINVDVCIGFKLGVANTRLLQTYSQIDPKLKQLAILLKQWSKQRNPHTDSGGYISSYAFTLMCIHYMQKEGLLPYLQELVDHPQVNQSDIDHEWPFVSNLDRVLQIWSPRMTNCNLAQLFFGFFQYYSNYDFAAKTISIRLTSEILRENVSAVTDSGISETISIEEPFIRTDIGKHAGTPRVIMIQLEIRETLKNILCREYQIIFQNSTSANAQHTSSDTSLEGQLLVDDRRQLIRVFYGDNSSVIVPDCNKTCHGDIVSVTASNGVGAVVDQVDSKYQKIAGWSTGNLLRSLDSRIPDGLLSKYGIYPFNDGVLLLTRRTYPWKQHALMTMQQTNVLGCSLDLHAQIRSVILSNFSNNWGRRESTQSVHTLETLYIVPAFHPDLSLYVSYSAKSVTLYLPDGINEERDKTNRIAVRLSRKALAVKERYSVFVDPFAVVTPGESEKATIASIFRDIATPNPSFTFDDFGYPNGISLASSLFDTVSQGVNQIEATGDTYEELLVRRYQTTLSQLSQIHVSFYILSRRDHQYSATVLELNFSGLFQFTLHIQEIDFRIQIEHVQNLIQVVSREESQKLTLHFQDDKQCELAVGQQVTVRLDVDVHSQIPFPLCVTEIY